MTEQVWMTPIGDLFLVKGHSMFQATNLVGVLIVSTFHGDIKKLKSVLKQSGCTYLGEL